MEDKRKDYDLYYSGTIIEFSNGESIVERELLNYNSSQPDVYHTVKQGETITQIAYMYYKDFTPQATHYWKYIADVNNILNPLDIRELVGYEILIPNYQLARLSE